MMEWVSVNERFPDTGMDGMPVIVVVSSGGRIFSEADAWHKHAFHANGGKFDFWGDKVTHWMPLPPPPGK